MSLETMTKLATYTVGAGGISSFVFSNIPQGYTDLKLLISSRQNLAQNYGVIQWYFNNDATTTYTYKVLYGYNSTVYASSQTATNGIYGVYSDNGGNSTSNVFSNMEFYIYDYASSKYKNVSYDEVFEGNSATYPTVSLGAGLYSSTLPVSSITVSTGGSGASFLQNSTYTLYGIKALRTAVGSSVKASGGAISFDGTYVYHTFNSTSTFTPTTNLIADYLVVAGGASGGTSNSGGGIYGGGGGAGGLRTTMGTSGGGATAEAKIPLNPMSYVVTIGAGGAAVTGSASTKGNNGSDSSFSTITSTGGGGGGAGASNRTGNSGGSGGGGGGVTGSSSATGGAGTSGQGYAGANDPGGEYSGGGGGAAGTPYTAQATSNPGGAGLVMSLPLSVTYAQGGMGGQSTTISGKPNTGWGGDGRSGNSGDTGAGGSGVVIIRYKG